MTKIEKKLGRIREKLEKINSDENFEEIWGN